MNNLILSKDSVIFQNRFFDIHTGELLAPIETPNYTVVQVAESYYLNKFEVAAHRQICDLEITLPLTAGIVNYADAKPQKLNKYEPCPSFRGQIHMLCSNKSGRFQTLAINIKDGPCMPLLQNIRMVYTKFGHPYSVDITRLLAAIVSEFTAKPLPQFTLQLDSLITQLLVKLSRCGEAPPEPDLTSRKLQPKIINYLDNHYLELDSAEGLSAIFGYSYSHICKTFSRVYKISPGAYLKIKRMEHAKEMLVQGKSVSCVAEKLGYASPFNFSRAYKIHYGHAPSKEKSR